MKVKMRFSSLSIIVLLTFFVLTNSFVAAKSVTEFPYPINNFSLTKKDDLLVMKLKTVEDVKLLLEYTKVDQEKLEPKELSFEKDKEFDVSFEIENGTYQLDLTLDHENYFFSTVINIEVEEENVNITNYISPKSKYAFVKKEDTESIGILNDSPSSALIIREREVVEGYISPDETDVDWYKFRLYEDAYIDLQLYSIPRGTDYDIYLYEASDTTDPIWRGVKAGNERELLRERLLESGWYYIKVKSFEGYSSTDSYLLEWEIIKQWPTESNRITQGFDRVKHLGVDVGGKRAGVSGDDVFAIWDGVVTRAGWSSSYGYVVYIRSSVHGDLVQSRYAHMLEDLQVGTNDSVKAGEVIGYMGNTGESQGVHLHFETRLCGNVCYNDNSSDPVDPIEYFFPEYDKYLLSSTGLNDIDTLDNNDEEELFIPIEDIKKMSPEKRAILSIPVNEMTPEQKREIGLAN